MTIYEGSTLKTCTHCGRTFPATREYFVVQRAAPSGFRAECRECHRAAHSKWYKDPKNHERQNKTRRDYGRKDRAEYPEKYLKAETLRRRELRAQGLEICGRCGRTWPAIPEFFVVSNGEISRTCHFCNRAQVQAQYRQRRARQRDTVGRE